MVKKTKAKQDSKSLKGRYLNKMCWQKKAEQGKVEQKSKKLLAITIKLRQSHERHK